MSKAIVWFRNDLRLHDHEALRAAIAKHQEVLFVYVFDPFWWGKDQFGIQKTGAFRTQFLLQSVEGLRAKIQSLGSDLIMRIGSTAEELAAIHRAFPFEHVYYHQGFADEETKIEHQLKSALPNVNFHGFD